MADDDDKLRKELDLEMALKMETAAYEKYGRKSTAAVSTKLNKMPDYAQVFKPKKAGEKFQVEPEDDIVSC